jgi:hypothetical protein
MPDPGQVTGSIPYFFLLSSDFALIQQYGVQLRY